jgi:excisionase family DNA binding protein
MAQSVAQQLALELVSTKQPRKPRQRAPRSGAGPVAGARLALSPDEAAALLGVSRDYFDEHVIHELRTVRRGRRILVPLTELERWLEESAARDNVGRRS